MCRFLYLRSEQPFPPAPVLRSFARMCKNSVEYQGHGWGCSLWTGKEWLHHWNLQPIWEDKMPELPEGQLLVAHARSAFRDQDIAIENNMPFVQEQTVFVFNGELHGVRLNVSGKTGAQKIFNLLLRFSKSAFLAGANKTLQILQKRTRYLKAINFLVCNTNRAVLCSFFNENPDYFTLHLHRTSQRVAVCSEPLDLFKPWQKIANNTIQEVWS